MSKTSIAWTDVTDNIIVAKGGGWWCRKISAGCDNCYAAKLNQSDYFGGNHLPYEGKPPELELRIAMMDGWKRQRNPKKHFVASMTDVFGEWVPQDWIFGMLNSMAEAPLQTFQVLTKRASVMAKQVLAWLDATARKRVPANIWLGFSAENQDMFDQRATHAAKLRNVCDVLWVSAEPLLGPINLSFIPNWIVWGGESGPNARRCDTQWIRDGVEACRFNSISAFVKQLGAQPYIRHPKHIGATHEMFDLRDSKGGDMDEWPADLRIREFPTP